MKSTMHNFYYHLMKPFYPLDHALLISRLSSCGVEGHKKAALLCFPQPPIFFEIS